LLARRLVSLDLAWSSVDHAPFGGAVAGDVGLAPDESGYFACHPDRGFPRAVLPALGGEPPRMTAISRTPFVVAHHYAEEETST
jgi:hypothetical protein